MPAEEQAIERKQCWIDGSMLTQLKLIAGHTGSTISEVLERLVRMPLTKEFARVVGELNRSTVGA